MNVQSCESAHGSSQQMWSGATPHGVVNLPRAENGHGAGLDDYLFGREDLSWLDTLNGDDVGPSRAADGEGQPWPWPGPGQQRAVEVSGADARRSSDQTSDAAGAGSSHWRCITSTHAQTCSRCVHIEKGRRRSPFFISVFGACLCSVLRPCFPVAAAGLLQRKKTRGGTSWWEIWCA